MSLNWDIGQIKDWETVTKIVAEHDDPHRGIKAGQKMMNPVTEALIWATMAIGVGEITSKTIDKFFERLRLVEKLSGPMLSSQSGDYIITRADVEKHMGLRTNVFPMWNDKKFYDHLLNLSRSAGVFKDKPKEEAEQTDG